MFKLTVEHPDHVPGARASLQKTLRMDGQGLFPESIRGAMLAVPCKRMLRAVYGSAWKAICAWAWIELSETATYYRQRIYLTKLEREIRRELETEDA